ncbi:MAG TPA: CRISPR-associated protein Cas2 [Pyrinomonadaceae bacterium]
MRTLLISYDLGVPETSEDYKGLIAHIKSYGPWAKPLYSVWFVRTNKTCTQVRDETEKFSDANDKLLVMDVTDDDWATKSVDKAVTDWMKK